MTAAIEFDCEIAIIGSGIAGSMLATILARHGIDVMVFEADTHPKFAIGESMILETSEIMRLLATVFDVPELEYFSSENFLPLVGNSHGVKRHFSYTHHYPGQLQDPEATLQAVIPGRPYGHELHIYRQDCDYFYAGTAVSYGAKLLTRTAIEAIETSIDSVTLTAADERRFRAKCVIDASGFRSVLATKMGVRSTDLRTHTRGIFTHMVDVPSVHEQGVSRSAYGIPYSLSEGTLHHVFRGGWMWVIPFNNHKESSNPFCSVGLMLDPREFPRPDSLPADEFTEFIARYPGMHQHLHEAKSVRSWVGSDRIQYTSTSIATDRACLLGHAAGFIDPLFSKGLYTSLASVLHLGKALLNAHQSDNYSQQQFTDVQRCTLGYVSANDRLVANAIKSFSHPELWRQFSVLWILGAYLELVKLTTTRINWLRDSNRRHISEFELPDLQLVGGGYNRYSQLAEAMHAEMESVDIDNPAAVSRCAKNMHSLIQANRWISYSFRELSNGKKHLPKHKYSWRLLMTEGGILGPSDYRRHFFGDIGKAELARFLLAERWRYSRYRLGRQSRVVV